MYKNRQRIKALFLMIPGGIMIIPLLLAMVMNTFIPAFFNLGTLTTALFRDGSLPLLGFLFFLVGTQFQLDQSIKPLQHSVILFVYKLAFGSMAAVLLYYFYGFNGPFGITFMVLFIALTQPNLAMYVAITFQFGRTNQLSMLPLFILLETPLFALLVLNMTSMIDISYTDFLAFLIPLALGVFIGSLLKEKRKEFGTLIPIVIPFFAFAVGSNFKLNAFIEAGLSGVLIAVLVLISGIIGFFLMQYIAPDHATSGIALGSTGSTSLLIPPIIATVDSRYVDWVPTLTAQLITVTVLTCTFSPVITKYLKRSSSNMLMKRKRKGYIDIGG